MGWDIYLHVVLVTASPLDTSLVLSFQGLDSPQCYCPASPVPIPIGPCVGQRVVASW